MVFPRRNFGPAIRSNTILPTLQKPKQKWYNHFCPLGLQNKSWGINKCVIIPFIFVIFIASYVL